MHGTTNQRTGPAPHHALPRWELVALIASLMALNALAIDVFIPALQAIGSAFEVADENRRQWVIPSYMLGFGLSQLIYGPVSDRFGRRPVLLFGIGLYVAASVACLFVPTYGALLAMRFIQGIGTAATRVASISVVRDSYGGARMASVMSLVMMVFMVVPILAPNIGQIIMLVGDWQEVFLVTAAMGLVMAVWMGLRLPETLHPDYRRPLTLVRVREAFWIVLTNRRSFGYTVALALVFGGLFGFINQAEQVFAGIFALGDGFTLAFSAIAIFMAFSNFANSRLVERIGMRRLSHGALTAFVCATGLALAAVLAYGGRPPFWVFLPTMGAVFFCFGFIGTNFNALAMDPLGHVAGTASSVLGFFQTFFGGLIGAAIGYAFDGTLVPLVGGFFGLSLAALACVALGERGRLFTADAEATSPAPAAGAPAPTRGAAE